MENIQEYLNFCNNKKIGIFGLARSGISTLLFCERLILYGSNLQIYAYDDCNKKQNEYKKYFLNIDNPNWQHCDFIIMSPGISKLNQFHNILHIKKISDIEFYYKLHLYNLTNEFYIAITGTNGKSTITTQISCAFNIFAYGNIGNGIFNKLLQNENINYNFSNNLMLTEKANLTNAAENDKNNLILFGQNNLSILANESNLNNTSKSNLRDDPIKNITLLEISSFQLDLQDVFKANIVAITNITEDHLDRYKNMQEYINSKLKILQNSTDQDFAIINIDDEVLYNLFLDKAFLQFSCKILFISLKHYMHKQQDSIIYASLNISQIELFTLKEKIQHAIYINYMSLLMNNNAFDNINLKQINDFKMNNADLIKKMQNYIKKNYNYQLFNKIFSIIIIQLAAIQRNISSIDSYLINLSKYQNLTFCNQLIKQMIFNDCEISIINDSKGTNPASTAASIGMYENIYLIAGGIFKSNNLEQIEQYQNKIIKIFLYGKDKYIMQNKLQNKFISIICKDLDEALTLAFNACKEDAKLNHNNLEEAKLKHDRLDNLQKNNDISSNVDLTCHISNAKQRTILFSPMAASLDMFESFYHRGLYFNALVDKLLI